MFFTDHHTVDDSKNLKGWGSVSKPKKRLLFAWSQGGGSSGLAAPRMGRPPVPKLPGRSLELVTLRSAAAALALRHAAAVSAASAAALPAGLRARHSSRARHPACQCVLRRAPCRARTKSRWIDRIFVRVMCGFVRISEASLILASAFRFLKSLIRACHSKHWPTSGYTTPHPPPCRPLPFHHVIPLARTAPSTPVHTASQAASGARVQGILDILKAAEMGDCTLVVEHIIALPAAALARNGRWQS